MLLIAESGVTVMPPCVYHLLSVYANGPTRSVAVSQCRNGHNSILLCRSEVNLSEQCRVAVSQGAHLDITMHHLLCERAPLVVSQQRETIRTVSCRGVAVSCAVVLNIRIPL